MVDADSSAGVSSTKDDDRSSSAVEEKKVRFDAPSDEEKKRKAAEKRKRMNHEARAQTRFTLGNDESSKLKSLLISAGGLALIVVFGIQAMISDITSSDAQAKRSSKILEGDQINKFAKSMVDLVFEETEKDRRTEHCSLFVYESSIPCDSNGIFAGQVYEEGDEVFRVPWYVPVDEAYIASFAFITKFHPTLANIEGPVLRQDFNGNTKLGDLVFRATKRIAHGDELFLPFESHPASLLRDNRDFVSIFESIPTPDQYNLVDKLTKDVENKHRGMEIALGRRPKDPIKRFNIAHLFGLSRTILNHVNPIVSELLPKLQAEYIKRKEHGGPARLSLLSNHSLSTLQMRGSCLTDITPTHVLSEAEYPEQKSTKKFAKNDVVHSIPLYIQFRSDCSESEEKECILSDAWAKESPCFSTFSSRVALCPLTGFQPQQSPGPDEPANVEVRWKSKSFSQYSLDELKLAPAATLSLEVIALDAIYAHEKLLVSDVEGLADKLIPKHWHS